MEMNRTLKTSKIEPIKPNSPINSVKSE
jgi:hypothetical protein